MWIADQWKEYELLDASDGERLERWGNYILIRPDPQIIWKGAAVHPAWKHADGIYRRSATGGGSWIKNKLPEQWQISYGKLRFLLRPMGFKHTGLFPEQAVNWDWFSGLIRDAGRPSPRAQSVCIHGWRDRCRRCCRSACRPCRCRKGNRRAGKRKCRSVRTFGGAYPLHCGRLQKIRGKRTAAR